ncbi:MAG: hypothetical protein LBL69_06380 [Zoogloeaceae bacterium]|jgi:hypothetical protein|nr:hypothetical protein [Zoogloeaceae bacterium]
MVLLLPAAREKSLKTPFSFSVWRLHPTFGRRARMIQENFFKSKTWAKSLANRLLKATLSTSYRHKTDKIIQ